MSELDFDIDAGMWGANGPQDLNYNFDQLYFQTSGNPNFSFNFGAGGSLYANVSANIGADYTLGFGPEGSLDLDSGNVDIQCDINTNDAISSTSSSNQTSNTAPDVNTAGWTVATEGMQTSGIDLADSSLDLSLAYQLYAAIYGSVSASAGVNIPATYASGNYPWPFSGSYEIQLTPSIQSSIGASGSFDNTIADASGSYSLAQLGGDDESPYTLDYGYGDLTAQVPDAIDLSTSQDGGSSLSTLSTSGQSSPFLSASLNVPAVIAAFFGVPPEVFSGSYPLFDLGIASGSIDYTTLAADLTASASYSQSFNFTPNAVQVVMTDSLGQTISGALGGNFQFGSPLGQGEITVDATYTLSGNLTSETDLVLSGGLAYTLLSLDAQGQLGADVLGYDIDASGDKSFTAAQGNVGLGGDVDIPIFSNTSTYTAAQISETFTVYYRNLPILAQSVSGLTNKTSETITVSASVAGVPDDAVTGVEIYDVATGPIGDGATDLGAATENSSGEWTFTANLADRSTYDFEAVATDSLGNSATSAPVPAVVVATQAPTVSASESISGTTGQTSDTITVTAAAEDVEGDAIASVEIYDVATGSIGDGATYLGAAASNGNGTWSFTASNLAEGTHDFSAVVTDLAGNSATASLVQVNVQTALVTIENFGTDASPKTDLTIDAAGDLFGTSEGTPFTGNNGLVFEIPKTASGYGPVTVIDSFTGGSQGAGPEGGLVLDANGDLFGTTYVGGSSDDGTVFEIPKTASGYGSVTVLASFTGTDGDYPLGSLIADANGDLFGTTLEGGSDDDGTVFEIPKTASGYGHITDLYSFTGADSDLTLPNGGLITDANGDLFGTTYDGGPSDDGMVFEIPKTASGYGSVAVLASFTGSDGGGPEGGLIADANGDLLGTTSYGGPSDDGTVFEIPKTASGYGPLTVLYSFAGDGDGAEPNAGLIIDANGDLFGTTSYGGVNSNDLLDGTVFEIPKTASGYGPATVIYDLTYIGGDNDLSVVLEPGLSADADGDLLGATTTYTGTSTGVVYSGSLFEIMGPDFVTVTIASDDTDRSGATSAIVNVKGVNYVDAANDVSTQTLTGRGLAGDTVSLYNGSTLVASGIAVNSSGNWSYQIGHLADGSYAYAATTSFAGTTSPDSTTFSFNVATLAPTVSASESVSGLTDQTSDTITVSASAEAVAANAIAGVEIYDGASPIGAATLTNGEWTYTASNLADGAHDFSAVVTDTAGNSASAALAAVDVATQAPTVSASESVSGLTDRTSDAITVTASSEAVTGNAIAGVEIYDDAKALGAATLSNGVWTYTASNLTDGAHDFSAVATDLAGNSASPALAAVDVATQAPSVAASESVSGPTNRTSDTITVSASVEAATGDAIASVEIYDGASAIGVATLANGEWTYAASNLADGAHDFSAVVTDTTGNSASAALAAVDVATQAPTVSASESVSGLTDQPSDTITVTASPEAVTGNATAGVEIYEGGTALGAATSSDGVWTYTASNLADGAHDFSAVATDSAGNSGSAALAAVDVATQAPPGVPPNFFNNVGKAGILWQNTNGDVELWNPNSDSESFTGENLGLVNTSWQIAGTGDFNGVGEVGILWRNTNGGVEFWSSNGSGGFTYDDLGVVNTSWQIAGTGDFDGSGEAGILWRNADGGTELWNPNGSGGFTYDNLGSVNTSWQIAGTGDLSGNGEDGILWRNTNGDLELWNPNGSGGFTYEDLGAINTSWQIAGTGDFSGDGQSGILWRNTNGDTELWNPNGSGGFTYQDLGVVNTSWQIAGTGDFSGSGQSGILWRNTNGDTELWNPNGLGGFTYENLGVVSTSWSVHKIFA
jgi:uncharacterized repeat protein (TIGR03803 family)